MLANSWQVSSLTDLGIHDPIPETGATIEANAHIKARYLFDRFGKPCFADDSGLEVSSLGGAPGVFSARYAGEQKSDEANMDKLLFELQGKQDRSAQFKTIICFVDAHGTAHNFEGTILGMICLEKRGLNGFGYDPVFIPDGYQATFAEMNAVEKNMISHRAIAVQKLVNFLNSDHV